MANKFLASTNMVELLAKAAETSPHPGLVVGREFRASALGSIGDLIQSAPTLRSALQALAEHEHSHAPGSVTYLIEDTEANKAFFGTAAYQPDQAINPSLCDCLAMAAVTLVREVAGSHQDPVLQVLLSRTEPADLESYRSAFGVDLRFNAEQTAVVLLSSRLDEPLPGADAALHTSAQGLVRAARLAENVDIVIRLRRSLRVAMMKGKVSANQVSVQLGMSRRTLHRRLEEAGVHYQEILDQTRCAFAQQLLAGTTLRIGEVATIVGYTDPSALTRRFIRWTGIPPNEWRTKLKPNP